MLFRKADAYGIWTNLDGDSGVKERDYATCCHCDFSYEIIPGSGRTRGWCANCARPTCGTLTCQPCVPFMKKIEAAERRFLFLQALGLA